MSALDTLLGRPAPRRKTGVPRASAPSGPPGTRGLTGELASAVQLPRLLRATPWLTRAPRGNGQTVIDFPGWRAPEASNVALRSYLRLLGYDTRPWGLGTNRGTPEQDAEQLVAQLEARPDAAPVALVGWSLGGVVAREIARAVPERVSCVVTFGSPIVGGPTYTVGAGAYAATERTRIDALARRLDADQPIQVPITTIYTRRDHVVDWRACIDRSSPRVQHVEVGSTHLGLGIDPDVWWAVAHALADAPWTSNA